MSSKYQPVADLEKPLREFGSSWMPSSEASLLTEEETDFSSARKGLRPDSKWLWLAHIVLLSLSTTFFIVGLSTRASTLEHVRKFSSYSPAATAVEYQKVKFNATMGEGSPFVGKGEEVDRAWHTISYDIGDQMISEAELELIDMPKSHLKVKHPKTGVEGYRVGLEVFHQLHCINLLRQVTYKEHYMEVGNGNFAGGEEELQMHTDHCLEILRMNAQCNADIGLFTFYMEEGDPLPWPELNSWHQCRNFDRVRDWALENSVGNMERGDVNESELS